jgi:predicted acylesterase/phospholipase RssA
MGDHALIKRTSKTKLGIVLQGGGTYGAFALGALLRLLEDPRVQSGEIEIVVASGTSAGAFNAAALVSGLNKGGPEYAIENLTNLWAHIGVDMPGAKLYNPFWPNIPTLDMYNSVEDMNEATTEATLGFLNATKNPFLVSTAKAIALMTEQVNMLKEQSWVAEQIRYALNTVLTKADWDAMRDEQKTKLHVYSAIEDPKTKSLSPHLFDQTKLRAKDIVACCSLKFMGHADHHGVVMRDGAYLDNSCLDDIVHEDVTDILAITLHGHPEAANSNFPSSVAAKLKPKTTEIHDDLTRLLHQKDRDYFLHEIAFHPSPRLMDSSRMNPDKRWLKDLERKGYEAASAWLDKCGQNLSKKDSYIPPHPSPQRKTAVRTMALAT